MQNTTNMQWGWNYKAMKTLLFCMVRFGKVDVYLWIKSSLWFLFLFFLSFFFLPFFPSFLSLSLPPPFFSKRTRKRQEGIQKQKYQEPTSNERPQRVGKEPQKWQMDPNTQVELLLGMILFHLGSTVWNLLWKKGKPSSPLGWGPRMTKSCSQREHLNPFFKKEREKNKRCLPLSSSDWETPPFWIT